VTALKLAIRKMRTDTYLVPNMTHWCQCSNHPENCPVFTGDTRVTMVYVPPLKPEELIPKAILMERLMAEAPAFLRTLLDVELPPLTGRLRIPIVNTEHKRRAQQLSKNALQVFIDESLFACPGSLVPFGEFYSRFIEWCQPEDRGHWTRIKVSKAMPMAFSTGAGNGNKTMIINASWEKETPESTPYTIIDGKVRRIE
jgi:hypothetical protein